jgi:hypothetical protein
MEKEGKLDRRCFLLPKTQKNALKTLSRGDYALPLPSLPKTQDHGYDFSIATNYKRSQHSWRFGAIACKFARSNTADQDNYAQSDESLQPLFP